MLKLTQTQDSHSPQKKRLQKVLDFSLLTFAQIRSNSPLLRLRTHHFDRLLGVIIGLLRKPQAKTQKSNFPFTSLAKTTPMRSRSLSTVNIPCVEGVGVCRPLNVPFNGVQECSQRGLGTYVWIDRTSIHINSSFSAGRRAGKSSKSHPLRTSSLYLRYLLTWSSNMDLHHVRKVSVSGSPSPNHPTLVHPGVHQFTLRVRRGSAPLPANSSTNSKGLPRCDRQSSARSPTPVVPDTGDRSLIGSNRMYCLRSKCLDQHRAP